MKKNGKISNNFFYQLFLLVKRPLLKNHKYLCQKSELDQKIGKLIGNDVVDTRLSVNNPTTIKLTK